MDESVKKPLSFSPTTTTGCATAVCPKKRNKEKQTMAFLLLPLFSVIFCPMVCVCVSCSGNDNGMAAFNKIALVRESVIVKKLARERGRENMKTRKR